MAKPASRRRPVASTNPPSSTARYRPASLTTCSAIGDDALQSVMKLHQSITAPAASWISPRTTSQALSERGRCGSRRCPRKQTTKGRSRNSVHWRQRRAIQTSGTTAPSSSLAGSAAAEMRASATRPMCDVRSASHGSTARAAKSASVPHHIARGGVALRGHHATPA